MNRILLVDDHEIVRRGLADIITTVPDLVLLDVRMPNTSGTVSCEALLARWPDLKIVMLSTFADEDAIQRCLLAGARGYLLKDVNALRLLDQLRCVLRGEIVLDPKVAGAVVGQMRQLATEVGLERPSEREREVLREVALGLTSREIARDLLVGESTIKTHIQHLMHKLNASNRAELVAEAMRHHLLEGEDESPARRS